MPNRNWQIETFDPLSAPDNLLEQYIEFCESTIAEAHPLDPLPPRRLIKDDLLTPHPHMDVYRWLIYPVNKPERLIGRGKLQCENEDSPSYRTSGHIVFGGIDVARDFRRRGIGTQCMQVMLAKAGTMGKTTFIATALLDIGHQFCRNHDGTNAFEFTENRLYLENVDWQKMQRWRQQGPIAASGVGIEVFSEVPEKDILEYSRLCTEVINQQPFGKVDIKARVTPESLRLDESLQKQKGINTVTMITREKSGVISGLTQRIFTPELAHRIYVGFTGVKEQYRGRGLGKWLKSEMLCYIKKHFPSVLYEFTDNATTNAPMLHINDQMGYQKHTTYVTYTFDIKKVAE